MKIQELLTSQMLNYKAQTCVLVCFVVKATVGDGPLAYSVTAPFLLEVAKKQVKI